MSQQITCLQENTTTDTSAAHSPYLKEYNLHSWKPNPSQTFDENYMDIVMLLTRSSHCRQGSMGCILVSDADADADADNDHDNDLVQKEFNNSKFSNAIIAASTNQSLFNPMDSDIHAEIATLGKCNQNGNSTKDCTVYITMPPCKRCFGALVSAGINRIVSNREYAKAIQDAARERNIDLVTMSSTFSEQQKDRISQLVGNSNSDNTNRHVLQERERRKEDKKRRKIQGTK